MVVHMPSVVHVGGMMRARGRVAEPRLNLRQRGVERELSAPVTLLRLASI